MMGMSFQRCPIHLTQWSARGANKRRAIHTTGISQHRGSCLMCDHPFAFAMSCKLVITFRYGASFVFIPFSSSAKDLLLFVPILLL